MKRSRANKGIEVLFLIPPIELNRKGMSVDHLYGCNYGFDYKTPIHMLQLASMVETKGYNIRLLDCPAEGYSLKHLVNFLSRQKSLRAVVFSTVWLSAQEDIAAAGIISDLTRGTDIIFTGTYPTWKPEFFLKRNNYFVVRGEPEEAVVELLDSLKRNNTIEDIKNVSWIKDGRIQHASCRSFSDLDSMPIPDRGLLCGNYHFNRIDSYPVTAACFSRGCIFKCVYCAPHALDQAIELEQLKYSTAKPPLRMRSAENIIKEFRDIYELGYKGVEICDNQFVWDSRRVISVCEGIKGLGLEWICCARADYLKDRVMLKAMRQAGCRMIYLGTESFRQQILDDTGKEIKVEDSSNAVKLLRECGIEPEISVLAGASGLETQESVRYSVKEALKLKTEFIHFGIAMPLPNTQLYKLAKAKGWLIGGDFYPKDNIRDCLLELPSISAKKIKRIIRQCYFIQYFSIRFIAKQVFSPYFKQRFAGRFVALKKLFRYLITTS